MIIPDHERMNYWVDSITQPLWRIVEGLDELNRILRELQEKQETRNDDSEGL